MGAVWVNGHNLGRFWDHGGLRSLFLPRQWLKSGRNEIIVLELHDAPKVAEVSGSTKIIEEPAVPFAVRLDRAVLTAPVAAPVGVAAFSLRTTRPSSRLSPTVHTATGAACAAHQGVWSTTPMAAQGKTASSTSFDCQASFI